MMGDNKTEWREKLWWKFADADLLKKKKAEGTRTEKIKTEKNFRIVDKFKVHFY